MSIHPHIPEAKSPKAQLAVIIGKLALFIVIVVLVVASVVQQHNQTQLRHTQSELRKAQDAAAQAQLDADRAHNLGACGMRKLTHTLIGRTKAALKRPTTTAQDKPGFQFAIDVYQGLNNAQVTIPHKLDCAALLQHP